MIRIKRTYDPPARGDGRRILVERLWPRGMKKESLAADAWMKDVAPSTELRKWFGHDPVKWQEFQRRYREELRQNPECLATIKKQARNAPVTLVYGAKDEQHNDAVVLLDFLKRQ